MRATVAGLAITIVAALLTGAVLWLAYGGERQDGPAVGFPGDARGVLDDPAAIPSPRTTAGSPVTVRLEVIPRARLEPARSALPMARLWLGEQEIATRATPIAGPRAAQPDAPIGGRHLVRFDLADGTGLCRIVELDPERPVDVRATAATTMSGRVVDADGASVAGASVWTGTLDAAGAPITVATDAGGVFVCDGVLATAGVPLTVWAAGRASRFLVRDASSAPVEIALEPAAAVDVVLGVATNDPTRGRVVLAPTDRETASIEYPYFAAGLRGTAHLRADGTASIDDLPRGIGLVATVAHPQLGDIAGVTVSTRRVRQRVVVTGAVVPMLHGAVRDAAGVALPDIDVRATAIGATTALGGVGDLLDAAAHAPWLRSTRTTLDGRFEIARVGAPRASRVQFAAATRLSVSVDVVAQPADVAYDCVLPPATVLMPPFGLRLHFAPRGRALRIVRSGRSAIDWADSVPFELRLGEAALVDVRAVLSGDEGGPAIERTVERLPVTGMVDVEFEF